MNKQSIFFSKARRDAVKNGFRSAFEKRVSEELTKSCIEHQYEPADKHLEYFIKSKGVCNECGSHDTIERHEYIPDFYIKGLRGKPDIVLESKGNLDPPSAKKMVAVKKYHPEVEIVFLFMKNGKVGRGKYSDYCEKNGFSYFFEGKDKEKLISYLKRK